MSTNKKNKLIPKLRFPEFKNDGEWEVKRLGEVIHRNNKRNKGNFAFPVQSVSNKFGFIDQEEYFDDRILASNDKSNYYIIEKGNFAYNPSRINVGSLAYKNDDKVSIISPLYVSFFAEKKLIEDLFLFYWLGSEEFVRQMNIFITGGVRNTLGYESLIKIRIPVPSLPEQQKIAACLSSLDELIAAERQKLDVLKAHKKGLLQNLFPQEGETLPRLRFPEFQNSGEWEVKRLGDVGKIVTGSTPSKKDPKNWNGDFVWITAQDFKGKYISDSTEKLTDKGKLTSRIIPKNSVLVTCIASIGLNAINKVECATNQQINAIICKDKIAYHEFIYYCIVNNENRLKNIAGHTAVPIINKSNFEKFAIPIPSLSEQQKIADCLSALDEQIEAQRQKVEQLREHKKGLLQGLFPAIVDTGHGLCP